MQLAMRWLLGMVVVALMAAAGTAGPVVSDDRNAHERVTRGTHQPCGLTDYMALIDAAQSQKQGLDDCTVGTDATSSGEPDYEFLQRRLGSLCESSCHSAVASLTETLSGRECDLQLENIADSLSQFGSQVPEASQAAQALRSLIDQGITEITYEEFAAMHSVTVQACAPIPTRPGVTCAQEFVALGNDSNPLHAQVCQALDESCVTLASSMAAMYNAMRVDLCHGDVISPEMAALCQQHTATTVIRELVGSNCDSQGGGPTLSPEEISEDSHIQGDVKTGRPTTIPGSKPTTSEGMASSTVAIIVILACSGAIGIGFAAKIVWKRRSNAYNPVEMYNFDDQNDNDDWGEDENDDALLNISGDAPLGSQSPELEAANARELMENDDI